MAISAQLNVENFEHMRAQPPREFEWLRIDPNYNCNVQCVYCHSSRSDKTISLTDLSEFLGQNVIRLENVQFGCIMEPTLDKRLADAMMLVAESGAKPSGDLVVQTNGILLHTHNQQKMLDAGLTHLSVSIDSTNPDTLAKLRGGSSFQKVANNVIAFKKNSPETHLQILTTVTRANIHEIIDLVSWGIEIGADRFVLREVFHYPNNPVVDHEGTTRLLLKPGQFETMQREVENRFRNQTRFHFAPSNDLRKHIVGVHKESYAQKKCDR